MRTTLTLDDDVALKLDREVRRSGHSFKQTVNDLLRAALAKAPPRSEKARAGVRPRPLGLREGLDYDNVWLLIDRAEGPDHR